MSQLFSTIKQWFDTSPFDAQNVEKVSDNQLDTINWLRVLPFLVLHAACLLVFVVGVSWVAIAFAAAMYLLRMFAITAFYHRYFSHRSFKTSRPIQFIFAFIGATATQRGPLWWAAHHREHHSHADTDADVHSPKKGFLWSHMGWFLCDRHYQANYDRVKDYMKFRELRWLDRFDIVAPFCLALFAFLLGLFLEIVFPQLGTTAWQMLVWGYFVSTVVLIHATLLINSLAHKFGSRRFNTNDDSRNNLFLAIITLGEGWHNNHHHHAGSARQGFYWWEIDISYYVLKLMASLGLIWDMKQVPKAMLALKRLDAVEAGS